MEYKRFERFGEKANYGEIYSACLDRECQYVLKYLPFDNGNSEQGIRNEIEMQNEVAKINLALPVIDYWFSDEGGSIVMDKLDYTAANLFTVYRSDAERTLILANILMILSNLHSSGFYHGDLHLNNIMIKGRDYYFIDFGMSGRMNRLTNLKNKYKDYGDIYDHLLELQDEDPSMKNTVKIMKIHMENLEREDVNILEFRDIDENCIVKYNDKEYLLKYVLSIVQPGEIIEGIPFECMHALLRRLNELRHQEYSFSTDRRYGKWRFILFGKRDF